MLQGWQMFFSSMTSQEAGTLPLSFTVHHCNKSVTLLLWTWTMYYQRTALAVHSEWSLHCKITLSVAPMNDRSSFIGAVQAINSVNVMELMCDRPLGVFTFINTAGLFILCHVTGTLHDSHCRQHLYLSCWSLSTQAICRRHRRCHSALTGVWQHVAAQCVKAPPQQKTPQGYWYTELLTAFDLQLASQVYQLQ